MLFTTQVIPNVYQFTFRYANVFLIVEDKLTLIDTGVRGNSKWVLKSIYSLGRSPEEINLIVLTHNHFDHTGGLEAFRKLTRAKVAAPKIDFTLDKDIVPYPNYVSTLLAMPGFSLMKKRWILTEKDVDTLLEDGDVLPVLGGLQCISTPGHTSGSMTFYIPQKKLLFVGDAIKKRRGLHLPLKTATTDVNQAKASIEKLAKLDVETICFGHGRPITKNAKGRLAGLVEKIRE
jgi:glyoxylase-like metal-dependent hydrolase (beta-lactamase superfamily II)